MFFGAPALLAGISTCVNSAAVVTTANFGTAGGLAGTNAAQISDSYSTGSVTGGGSIGGALGRSNNGVAIRIYSSGSSSVGGLVGSDFRQTGAVDSYWDLDTSSQTSADGTGLNADQMTDQTSFVDWDFVNTWTITDGETPSFLPDRNTSPVIRTGINVTVSARDVPTSLGLQGFDLEGGALTISIITQPTQGTLSTLPDGDIGYTPGNFDAFEDSLTYQVTDDLGATSPVVTANISATHACNPAVVGMGHGGDGSVSNPYGLSTVAELQLVGANNACAFVLVNDIDLTGVTFAPIGSSANPTIGVFDGNNHQISNWTFSTNSGSDGVGFFAILNGATVKNLNLVNVNVSGPRDLGALAGTVTNSTLTNDSSTGSVHGGQQAGGLVGQVTSSTITLCHSDASVIGGNNAGGLTSNLDSSSVSQCYATGAVSGQSVEGGFAVAIGQGATVSRSYATGSVTGLNSNNSTVGGFAGFFDGGSSITDCYASGAVSTKGQGGGFIGNGDDGQSSVVQRVYTTSTIGGTGSTKGGLFALMSGSYTVTDAFWDQELTGLSSSAGGLGTDTSDANMMIQSTFTDFDFVNTWVMSEVTGYPVLR